MSQRTRLPGMLLLALFSLAPVTEALDLRIMSFNVQQPWGTNWDGRKAAAATLVNRESPDVLGTQEATKDQLDHLTASCPGYDRFGAGRDGGDAGESSVIFWKSSRFRIDLANSGNFWLSGTPSTPSRFGGSYNRIATFVRLVDKQTNEGFTLFNLHNYMPAESDFRMRAAKLVVQTLAARAYPSEAVFLTGDFNSTEGDAVTLWMKSGSDNPMRFRDSYREVDPNGSVTTGFGTKFDYIYVPDNSRYRTVRSFVPASPVASDHYPIVADVVASVPSKVEVHPSATGTPSHALRIRVTNSSLQASMASSRPIDHVELLDTRGVVLRSSSVRQEDHSLDLSSVPRGTWFVRVRSEGSSYVQAVAIP